MPIETTTVQGKVFTPSGAVATDGRIVAQLSAPGSTPDTGSGENERVNARTVGTIAADGSVTGLKLVPNDAITPAGTTYKVSIEIYAPERHCWPETWSIATAPDPIDIGAITPL